MGLYKAAATTRGPDDELVDSNDWLTAMAAAEGVGPDDAELKEYQDHWLLELKVPAWDRLRQRKVKRYARNRWTIDTLFKEAGIVLPGPMRDKMPCANSPTVQAVFPMNGSKAFVTSTTQVIFPFYYAAAIQAGILAMPLLDRLIMEDVPVNSHTADHAMMTDTAGDRVTAVSSEGAYSTEIIIRAINHPIVLHKYVSKALATYESIRLQRIPIFERGLMRVGQQFMIEQTNVGIDTLVNGDGTTVAPGGGAAPTYPAAAAGAPVYRDIIKLDTAFPQGYEVIDGIFVMPIDTLIKVLDMPEFKDPLAGWHYQNDGAYPTPVGKPIYRWDATAGASGIDGLIPGWTTGSMMEVKPGIAMVKYTEGGILVETDRLIDGQWDKVVSSTWTGYGIWDRKGVVVGTSF